MEKKIINSKESSQTEKSILTGMQEAVLYSKGKLKVLKAKKHNILLPEGNIYEARDKLKLTQEQFATIFVVSVSTKLGARKTTPNGNSKITSKNY